MVLAPMAGGPSTPELVAAVSCAGGLGVFGVTGMDAEAVRAGVARALKLSDGAPVGVNVQLAPAQRGAGRPEDVAAALAPLHEELGLDAEELPRALPEPAPDLVGGAVALVEAAVDAGARVVSAALGDPAPLAAIAREAGLPLLAMVSTVEEARRAVAAGADAVMAQGAEAGGHRGVFEHEGEPPLVGTMALVPRVVDAIDVPVVAAGGIMDGRGLAAALMLGAQGAALGTRFLLAAEASVPEAHRRALGALEDTATVVTDAVTGRPARWVRNRAVAALEGAPGHLGWGAQRGAVARLRQAAADAGREDLLPMLAGQGGGMVARTQPAEEIVAEILAQARELLA